MLSDVRFALRLLAHHRVFTVAVSLTLALGIGATTAVYSIVDAVLLQPLPFPDPDRIVAVRSRAAGGGEYGISGGVIEAVRSLPAIERAAVAIRTEQNLVNGANLSIVPGAMVTAEFFDVFKAAPLLGRTLSTADRSAAATEVVLGEPLWRHRFDADPDVVGRGVRLDDRTFTVVGVMPASFIHDEAMYWRAMDLTATQRSAIGSGPFDAIARVAPAGLAAARAETDGLSRALDMKTGGAALGISLTPLLETLTAEYERALWSAMGAVALVLLIACGNVAHLLMTRTAERLHEFAIRQAVGASRGRLIRQLLIEAVSISAVSAAAGCAIAWPLLRLFPALGVSYIPRLEHATLDLRVMSFAIAVSALSVLFFGLTPALWSTRFTRGIVANSRAASRGIRRSAGAVVTIEIALTLVLLLGSALAGRSLYRVLHVDVGFDARRLSIATLRPTPAKYGDADRIRFYERVVDRVRDMPGVESVAATSHVPLGVYLAEQAAVTTAAGRPVAPGPRGARVRTLAPGSLTALGATILKGRDLDAADREGSVRAVVVNESLAALLSPEGDPLGQTLHVALGPPAGGAHTVVGVVRNLRASLFIAPTPELYVSSLQRPLRSMHLMVRSSIDPASLSTLLRNAVAAIDPDLPVSDPTSMATLTWSRTEHIRFRSALLTAFALFAIALAASGIAAVVMHAVISRTRELGIRTAIGARPSQLMVLVMRDLGLPTVFGVSIGLLASYGLTRAALRFMFVEPLEAGPALTGAGAVIGIALLAAWVPARRILRLNPVTALRSE